MAVKAVFQKRGAVAWGHSVADLLEELVRPDRVAPDLADAALELDKTYIASRYPDAHPSGAPRRKYTRTEAERMVGHAEKIVHYCEGFLPAVDT